MAKKKATEQNVIHEMVAVDELVPYARNARKHSDEQILQIVASIREFGFLSPLVIAADDTVIAGHGRLLAAMKLGMKELPCVRAAHLTKAQIRAYSLVDNRLAETSSWDSELMKCELDEILQDIPTLDSMGFSEKEMEGFFGGLFQSGSIDTDGKQGKEIEGSKEIEENDLGEFGCKCPRCGFEFNKG